MVWTLKWIEREPGGVWKLVALVGGRAATVAEFLDGLQDDVALRGMLDETLARVPFVAFRWEMPSLTRDRLHHEFECVVVDDPSLERPQNHAAFADHLEGCAEPDVAVFSNLGGDATLVVPLPASEEPCYTHLGAFVRGAPRVQRHALWRCVAETTLGRVDDVPLWLSTAGDGVAWLHVRLDDRPKYYAHAPYRSPG